MLLLIGLPGASEWLLIILVLFTLLVMPVFVIILFVRNRRLNNQIQIIAKEKTALLERLLDKR